VDAERAANIEGFAKIDQLRASAQDQADSMAKQLRAQLSEMESSGNRHQRRKAKVARTRIAAFERWYQRRLDTMFQNMVGGFDIETGTLRAVQEEASAKLAAIFN
jgi:hypothetical protein